MTLTANKTNAAMQEMVISFFIFLDLDIRNTDTFIAGLILRQRWLSFLCQVGPLVMAVYCLNSYSIPDLLKLLRQERADRIRLEVGSQPLLTIKDKHFEIDGPVVEEAVVEELLRTVADTRKMRAFRQRSMVDIIHTFDGTRFLVRAVHAFGTFNVELHAVKI
jgi:hypothetical protein